MIQFVFDFCYMYLLAKVLEPNFFVLGLHMPCLCAFVLVSVGSSGLFVSILKYIDPRYERGCQINLTLLVYVLDYGYMFLLGLSTY